MTSTLAHARSSRNRSSSGDPREQSAIRTANSNSNAHRHIKVSSRLAPQIYLGHIYSRPAENSTDAHREGVGGQVRGFSCSARGFSGACRGPRREKWQTARHLRGVAQGHPNVVQIFDTFVQRSHVFVVMEHCARGDLLADLVATQPESRLSEPHALRIVQHLARGLHFLHDTCNIAHRDVSLENVFVTRDGVHKIGDFGLSTRADRRASGCVGKSQYVAPEVVAEASYDPVTADVWSLGIVLFMLLTGAPLLELASPADPEFNAIKALGCRGVLRSWEMDTQLSTATLDLLSKMLEFDPIKRLQAMNRVLNHPALAAALDAEG
ncbi:protein kinase [Phytophthora infestans T30-4]|uniref:Protein kinase n=1 Tax=Phytophthora infestans (strain T30-4) TaxID=403677 RepID=D0P3V8_PHYIT|nr:protein kinase [Phytophthora infestans T30-4]EEY62054.1 protein kinase [Phytophthora infestans T30-4]|eukprot:XP_002895020.1 protein kinase [Phytophthora infestans T30-4]